MTDKSDGQIDRRTDRQADRHTNDSIPNSCWSDVLEVLGVGSAVSSTTTKVSTCQSLTTSVYKRVIIIIIIINIFIRLVQNSVKF